MRRVLVGLATSLLAVSLVSCAESKRGNESAGDTFVFGAAGAPKVFDPIFTDEGESRRIHHQMIEQLIVHKPGTAELAPGLATAWTPSDEGRTWTFTLREGVKFHDGTAFDGAAVCANFDRWFNMPGAAAQSQMIYYGDVFEGFKRNEGDAGGAPVYKSCEAPAPNQAVLHLNKAKGAFPAAFTLDSLSISSPTALKQYNADAVTQSGDSFSYGAYATDHPTGTGPFKFGSYDRTNQVVTLLRNDDYWGEKAKVAKLIFRIIPDENARKQELRAGSIDGYDYPNPADIGALRGEGFQVLTRKPFNILYLGINQKNNPALKDIRVRQAIAYGVNREALVRNKFPEGAEVANQFVPAAAAGYAPDPQAFPYDPNKAKALLAAAGVSDLTLNFYYPTEISRPYMPNPTDIFAVIAEDLRQVGIKINPVPEPWNGGYKDDVQKLGKHDLHLLGWTGDYNDPGNFVGTFFGRLKPEFGFDNPAMFAEIAKADGTVDPASHATEYQQVNRDLMSTYLPAVPLASGPAFIVVGKNVHGLVPSPLTNEDYAPVSKN
ncbi:ABC transporter substrate-binding protein [Pseudonocardia eucalypti]|uniref:ABC transporter substrate-binding protein n=1 Tax=Pseudonocardia eucalypti TaxID=648755 RepID=A0ABP9PDB0_9PSEU|nr:peptide/nickel transport system substrate-binding protein [Pseudonocardia eucalypti]